MVHFGTDQIHAIHLSCFWNVLSNCLAPVAVVEQPCYNILSL